MPYVNGQQVRVENTKSSENSQTVALSCAYCTTISIKVATKKSSLFDLLKLEDYSERAMKNVLVAWVAHKAGMQCSIRSSSISTVPYSMKNPITCFQLSPDMQQSITTPCILLEK